MERRYYNMGVVGSPAAHSLSPALHAYLLQEQGLVGGYTVFDTPAEGIPHVLNHAERFHYCGLNITLPYKKHFLEVCHQVDALAAEVGAVNTVKITGVPSTHGDGRNTTLIGYNTDITGFGMMLKHKNIDPEGKNILVLGAGGGAASVVYFLDKAGGRVNIFNRSPDNAKQLAASMGVSADVLSAEDVLDGDFYLTVNTTSVGVGGEVFDLFSQKIQSTHAVDLVYTCAAGNHGAGNHGAGSHGGGNHGGGFVPTPFLDYMQLESSTDGLLHLIYQGIESFKIFTDIGEKDWGTLQNPDFVRFLHRKMMKLIDKNM